MKGVYTLLARLNKDKNIKVGKIGKIYFKKGSYVYVGSALNGLEHRINRHLRKMKKTYWHIDYLLKHAIVTDVFYKETDKKKEECITAKKLSQKLTTIPYFGSSDCNCQSHLFYGIDKEEIEWYLEELKMKQFLGLKCKHLKSSNCSQG